jgi:hypothetical protein
LKIHFAYVTLDGWLEAHRKLTRELKNMKAAEAMKINRRGFPEGQDWRASGRADHAAELGGRS